ncbi:CoA transferase [Dehalococcoidia bacterium]|nr:CoA transferase [Dehalococcoidia bacterium]
MEQLPLDDITILDLSQNVAGQFCTKSLSWLGARVVLVEKPGGADTRRMAPFYNDTPETEHSLLHLYLNTNKESITLDIHTKEGAEILKELACRCDILVEDYPPGELESLGLGYSSSNRILQVRPPHRIAVSPAPKNASESRT